MNINALTYKVLNSASPPIYDLLRNTIYGTKGFRYRHGSTDKKITDLINPDFHTLWEGDKIVACAVYCRRKIEFDNKSTDAYYIRYFSVLPEYQSMGLGKLITEKLEAYYVNKINDPTVFYAYIEKKNLKSIGVSKHFNQIQIGTLNTLFFSRFFPKRHKSCKRATVDDLPQILSQLSSLYHSHRCFHQQRIGFENNYYIYKEGKEIIAGIQIYPVKWEIHHIPGFIGWLSLYVFPKIPILNRLAEGKTFNFIPTEGIFCRPGHTKKLLLLLEHILADQKQNKLFLYLDSNDRIRKELVLSKNMGLMQKLQHSPDVAVLGNFLHFTPSDEFTPNYYSGFDMS